MHLQYYHRLQTILAGQLFGVEPGWQVPAVYYDAPNGFGESIWVDALPETFIAARISGGSVQKVKGTQAGAVSRPTFSPSFEPAGVGNYYVARESIQFAHLHLPNELLDRASDMANAPPLSGRLRDDLAFFDDEPLETLIGAYIQRAFNRVMLPTSLEMEGRALLLLDRLLNLHGTSTTAVPVRGGLSQRELRRVTDYVQEHLAEDPALGTLAQLVGLSPKHFSRVFRRSTGIGPNHWLVKQRVARARELLADKTLSIAQIALACGFADQSHLTVTFRRVTGTTPGRFRRERQV
ncbi:MAG: AraC family transcriptional regulator [Micropepsaceae bacterium]